VCLGVFAFVYSYVSVRMFARAFMSVRACMGVHVSVVACGKQITGLASSVKTWPPSCALMSLHDTRCSQSCQ